MGEDRAVNVAGNAHVLLQSSMSLRGISDTMSQDAGVMTDDVAVRVANMSEGVGTLNENVLDIANAARLMEITDKRLWRIVTHYVDRAVAALDISMDGLTQELIHNKL